MVFNQTVITVLFFFYPVLIIVAFVIGFFLGARSNYYPVSFTEVEPEQPEVNPEKVSELSKKLQEKEVNIYDEIAKYYNE